jgi:hypothetical protein
LSNSLYLKPWAGLNWSLLSSNSVQYLVTRLGKSFSSRLSSVKSQFNDWRLITFHFNRHVLLLLSVYVKRFHLTATKCPQTSPLSAHSLLCNSADVKTCMRVIHDRSRSAARSRTSNARSFR